MRERVLLRVFLWAMMRQSAWWNRAPSYTLLYAWRGDTGAVVLLTLHWRSANGSTVSAEFRGSITGIISELITLTGTFDRPRGDISYL